MKLWAVYRMNWGGEYRIASIWDTEEAAEADEKRIQDKGDMEVTYVSQDYTLNTPARW